ncbi:hypothetical protein [Paraburkholderia rhynchosiae]|uniref:hypothetical protein n=1 Tax=Paraburkholderia rhynchosiae TaxID=487049 RepID=UPI00387E89D5
MEAEHAAPALEEAFARYGLPQIVSTDRGSQFASIAFTDAVLSRGIAPSMDGKGSSTTTFLWNGCGAARTMKRYIEGLRVRRPCTEVDR